MLRWLVALASGPTVEEVLDTVLPASVRSAYLKREEIANALVDSMRVENFMGYDHRFTEIDLAPPAPVHVPGQHIRGLTSVARGSYSSILTMICSWFY